MLMWRNWQTRQTQNLLVAIPCGFKSHLQHQRPGAPGAAADTCEAHGPRGLGRTQHKHLPLKTAFFWIRPEWLYRGIRGHISAESGCHRRVKI